MVEDKNISLNDRASNDVAGDKSPEEDVETIVHISIKSPRCRTENMTEQKRGETKKSLPFFQTFEFVFDDNRTEREE